MGLLRVATITARTAVDIMKIPMILPSTMNGLFERAVGFSAAAKILVAE